MTPTSRSLTALVAVMLLAFAAAAVSSARQPPNTNDPCIKAGRDSCGTTASGLYANYRYGLRWFGSYDGIVADAGRMFCIDLGYWYASPSYNYKLGTSEGLRNTLGQAVSFTNQERMAYALAAFGRNTAPKQQAAVMLYVHSLMGDAQPGEVDPTALGPDVVAIDQRIATDAARLHGPYRIVGKLAGPLRAGTRVEGTLQVLAASGAAVPGITLNLTATGATGVPATVTTNAQGTATLAFTPGTGSTSVIATAIALPSTLPTVYVPTTKGARTSAQRLVAAAVQSVSGRLAGSASKAHLRVSTVARPTTIVVGHVVRDHVTLAGVPTTWKANVSVVIRGPFAVQSQINCSKNAWSGSFAADGPGTYSTPVATVKTPGWYVFQIRVPGDLDTFGAVSHCDEASEIFFAKAAPKLTTLVSTDSLAPGTPLNDRLTVSGLAGTSVTATVNLFGPFADRSAISCSGSPVWVGSVPIERSGSYKTGTFTPTVPGVYTYQATIPGSDLAEGAQGACGDPTESTLVTGTPKVVTQASAARTAPGTTLTDTLDVTGAGALALKVQVELFGPFESRAGISCSGTPLWTGLVSTTGDGSYTTQAATIPRVGYYTFHESIVGSPENAPFVSACAETTETTLASSQPTVATVVSSQVVRPGSSLSDTIEVTGLGQTQAAIRVELFGPFATLAAVRCTGRPLSSELVTAQGDGMIHSPAVRIAQAGFYTFHETLLARPNVAGAETTCAVAAETSLGAPAIITGRGDHTRSIAVASAPGADDPVRVQIPSLGVDAPVSRAGIDLTQGVLAVPANIHHVGWWLDGATPHQATGSVVIAGHVDSAKGGAGAFFPLKTIRPGTLITVVTADGRSKSYRVVTRRQMLKTALPLNIWSQDSRNHLVLVTCGGPFDSATKHYRDNVVVTAVPVQ